MSEHLHYEVDGTVGVLTYDRPPVNALRYADLAALDDALSGLPRADELAVVLQTAGDRAFSAGHDVTEFDAEEPRDPQRTREIYMDLLDAVYTFPLPLIAAVDGPAVGAGAILPSLCDDRILEPDAHVAITEINVGIIGGLGPMRHVLPDGIARRLAYTGEELAAERAYELGYASELADDAQAAARELAHTIAANDPGAVRAAKAAAVDCQPDWPVTDYGRERDYIDDLREREDAGEAAQAFLEGREPDFGE